MDKFINSFQQTAEGLKAMNLIKNKGLGINGFQGVSPIKLCSIIPQSCSSKIANLLPGYNSILVSSKIRNLITPSNSLLSLKMLNDISQKRLSELTNSLKRIC